MCKVSRELQTLETFERFVRVNPFVSDLIRIRRFFQLIVVGYAVFGILVVSVRRVGIHHFETGYAQPYYHKYARYAYQDIQQSFQPYHTEGNETYEVESENTYGKPVKRADNGKYKRNNRKNVKCLFQSINLLVSCTVSISNRKIIIRAKIRYYGRQ